MTLLNDIVSRSNFFPFLFNDFILVKKNAKGQEGKDNAVFRKNVRNGFRTFYKHLIISTFPRWRYRKYIY